MNKKMKLEMLKLILELICIKDIFKDLIKEEKEAFLYINIFMQCKYIQSCIKKYF